MARTVLATDRVRERANRMGNGASDGIGWFALPTESLKPSTKAKSPSLVFPIFGQRFRQLGDA